MKIQMATLVAAVAFTGVASADVIIDTSAVDNQANLSSAAGQTFTTGTLTDTTLGTVEVFGPLAVGGTDPVTYGLSFHLDTDQDHTTWGHGASLGEVAAQTNTANGSVVFDFSGAGITLLDNTVYAIRFTDGAGTEVPARFGLNSTTNPSGATLFNAGATVFSDGFDAAIQINSVPEPGSLALLGLGGLLIARRRRA